MPSFLGQVFALLWTCLSACVRVCAFVPCIIYSICTRNWRIDPEDWKAATFWEGQVYHIRRKPIKNEFKYPVRVAVIELDSPPKWFRTQAKDHLTADAVRALSSTTGPVKLLTSPASAGYIQNPISVYFCYACSGSLECCVAEVTNTPWKERVTFLFDPTGARVPKALHVSPMMDMLNEWQLEASDPNDGIMKVVVNADHPQHGRYFDACLVARLSACAHQRNEDASLSIVLRYAFQPHRIAFWIYMQAVKLLWRGVPFYGPPDHQYQQRLGTCAFSPSLKPFKNGTFYAWRDASSWPWK